MKFITISDRDHKCIYPRNEISAITYNPMFPYEITVILSKNDSLESFDFHYKYKWLAKWHFRRLGRKLERSV